MVQKQNETFGVNLEKYCFYLNADFAAHTLMFGGPRGIQSWQKACLSNLL
jgi:hypothetical protein